MKGKRVLEIVLDPEAAAAAEIWPEAEVVVVKLADTRGYDPASASIMSHKELKTARALEKEKGAFGIVLAAHVLQCVERAGVVETLQRWAALLHPGGELHIIVPDLQWACEQVAQTHEQNKFVLKALFGGQGRAWDVHKTGFTVAGLRGALSGAGMAAKQARLGPYRIGDETGEMIARQIDVVAVRREA